MDASGVEQCGITPMAWLPCHGDVGGGLGSVAPGTKEWGSP